MNSDGRPKFSQKPEARFLNEPINQLYWTKEEEWRKNNGKYQNKDRHYSVRTKKMRISEPPLAGQSNPPVYVCLAWIIHLFHGHSLHWSQAEFCVREKYESRECMNQGVSGSPLPLLHLNAPGRRWAWWIGSDVNQSMTSLWAPESRGALED